MYYRPGQSVTLTLGTAVWYRNRTEIGQKQSNSTSEIMQKCRLIMTLKRKVARQYLKAESKERLGNVRHKSYSTYWLL